MSETAYGFDPVRFRAARVAAGVSVARIARAAGVTERAVSLYLAGSRVPRPEVLPGLAEAVGTTPAELCTVEREVLAHLRVFTGRSRAVMAAALGMGEETYRQLETTGHRGRLASSRYDDVQGRWVPWQEWAAPVFGVTGERLLAAEYLFAIPCVVDSPGARVIGAASTRVSWLSEGSSGEPSLRLQLPLGLLLDPHRLPCFAATYRVAPWAVCNDNQPRSGGRDGSRQQRVGAVNG